MHVHGALSECSSPAAWLRYMHNAVVGRLYKATGVRRALLPVTCLHRMIGDHQYQRSPAGVVVSTPLRMDHEASSCNTCSVEPAQRELLQNFFNFPCLSSSATRRKLLQLSCFFPLLQPEGNFFNCPVFPLFCNQKETSSTFLFFPSSAQSLQLPHWIFSACRQLHKKYKAIFTISFKCQLNDKHQWSTLQI